MSETLRNICCFCSSVTLGSESPLFRRSASSKLRSSSFCSASVYWFPPTLTLCVNSGTPPRTMLMFITLAPMFNSATVCLADGCFASGGEERQDSEPDQRTDERGESASGGGHMRLLRAEF